MSDILAPVKMTMRKFISGDYPDTDHSIYIVWKDSRALYVGISRDNIWNRWFSRNNSHILLFDDDHMIGWSMIGRAITNNLPGSLSWIIEFRDYDHSQRLETIEHDLIKELCPLFNTIYAGGLSKEDIKLKRNLINFKERIKNPPEDLISY